MTNDSGNSFDPSRREFLTALAASATLAACGDAPPASAVPYAEQPEMIVPGRPLYFATAVPFQGYAQPVLAESHMGRPTKLEGNPRHPASRGASDAFTQAQIVALYGPERSREIVAPGGAAASLAAFAEVAARAAGPGLRVLTGTVTSPTLARQLRELAALGVRWHVFEPVTALPSPDPSVAVLPRLHRAEVVVSVGADLLGPGPAQVWNLGGWSEARRGGRAQAWHVAEPSLSQTGTVAADHLLVPPSRQAGLVAAIAAALGVGAGPAPGLGAAERAWAEGAAAALAAARGSGLLAAGAAADQALALAVNEAIGALGGTLALTEAVALAPPDGADSFAALVRDMQAGAVEALLVLDANPLYAAPPASGFHAAFARVPLRLHAGLYRDETAEACHWHLPLAHPLEDWSDSRAVDGTIGIVQPLIAPLGGGISPHAVLAGVLGAPAAPLDILAETWRAAWGGGFEARWTRVLQDGYIAGTAAVPVSDLSAIAAPPPAAAPGGIELVFAPDPSVWDGRLAGIPWLQELPRPLTKLTWDNVVGLGRAQAAALGAGNGDLVEVSLGGRAVSGPAWVMPAQAEDTVVLFLGYGRRAGAGAGLGRGYDAYALRPAAAAEWAGGAQLRKLEGRQRLAVTQPHQSLAGHDDIIRTGTPPPTLETTSLYPPWPRPRPAWGMVIDLDLCTGCNACVIACQMENTVPYVGAEEVARGREMHWLRVDIYHEAEGSHFAPVPCMHCDQAPCEMGCPVNATVQGPEGLNQMVYSRCIGTRTCSSYCPWKVRRFNFFDYAGAAPAAYQPQRNPDVTVRGRGVMEKCTYCVQRISTARIEAKKAGRPAIVDGEVQTACQQACPARAIVFGDLDDPDSAVARAAADGRNYAMLGQLGTRPRTTYLAKAKRP